MSEGASRSTQFVVVRPAVGPDDPSPVPNLHDTLKDINVALPDDLAAEFSVEESAPEEKEAKTKPRRHRKALPIPSERKSNIGLFPVLCYQTTGKRWRFHEMPDNSCSIAVGNDPRICEVTIENPYADDVQITLQLVGDQWYVIESGRNNLAKINGFARRQGTITPHSSIFVELADTPIIFTIGKGASTVTDDELINNRTQAIAVQTAKMDIDSFALNPEEGFFGLATDAGPKLFPIGKTVLIGSNPLCDVRADGHDFVGVISCVRDTFYLYAKPGEHVEVDGQSSMEPLPLRHGSLITADGTKCRIKFSESMQQEDVTQELPDLHAIPLALLEVTESGEYGEGFILPDPGEIVKVGRSGGCHLLLDHEKVSRYHADLVVDENFVTLVDKGSRNGTYVDGEQISDMDVCPGQIIHFSEKRFLLCYAE